MKRLVWPIVLALALFGAWWWLRTDTVRSADGSAQIDLVVRTTGGASASESLPMIIALHGNGDTPADFFETLLLGLDARARVVLLRGPLEYSGGRFGGRAWPLEAAGVITVSDSIASVVPVLVERYPTIGRPILLGFSGGAVAAYGLAARHPDLFSSVLPLSGMLPAGVAPAAPSLEHRALSVQAFHGKRDQVISFGAGKNATRELERLAASVSLEELEGGHLDVFHAGRARLHASLVERLVKLSEGR